MQRLRNQGYIKIDSDNNFENMTQWDLMDSFEVRLASTMLTLSKIFFNLSDSLEDNWWIKYQEYEKKFERILAGWAKLTFDEDDDGEIDELEQSKQRIVNRWSR